MVEEYEENTDPQDRADDQDFDLGEFPRPTCPDANGQVRQAMGCTCFSVEELLFLANNNSNFLQITLP